MRFIVLLAFLPSCAATLEERCRYRAKQQAENAYYDKSASWCKTDESDGISKCHTPTRGDFFRMCMKDPESAGISP